MPAACVASQSTSTLQPVQPEPSVLQMFGAVQAVHASPQCAVELQSSQVPPALPPLHQLRAAQALPWFLQTQALPWHTLTKVLLAQVLLHAPQ